MKLFGADRGKHVALFAAVALLSPALMPLSAQAADSKKEKALKTGAVVLGAIGAYYAVKGKTLKGALAGAAGYYAYKKSKDAKNDRTAGDVYPDEVYTSTRNSDNRNSEPGYDYPEDDANYGVINDDVYDDDINGDYASTREQRRAERQERRAERRDERVNGGERYPDDPGYTSLDSGKTQSASTQKSTQATVLK